jgi:uncharacterized protein (TIGR02687 family)
MVRLYTGYEQLLDDSIHGLLCHVLLSALAQTLNRSHFKGLDRFVSESAAPYCYQLVYEWCKSNHRQTLLDECRIIEAELQLVKRIDSIHIDELIPSGIFPCIDESILKRLLSEVADGVIRIDVIRRVCARRQTSAWSSLFINYYDCLLHASVLQELIVEDPVYFDSTEAKTIWKLYRDQVYLVDTAYRRFHVAFAKTLTDSNVLLDDVMKKSVEVIDRLYLGRFLESLTAAWTSVVSSDYEDVGYVTSIDKQRNFYRDKVQPVLRSGNRAYVIISDALRYEVAAELTEELSRSTTGQVTINAMQAIFPGLTSYGMAALLPGNEISVDDKSQVFRDGKPTSDTTKRKAVLREASGKSTAVSFREFIRLKKQERRDLVAGMDVVYIYHNTIDDTGESQVSEGKVFEACCDAIKELVNVVRVIVNELSGANVFITADHGFLYTYSPLPESQKIGRQSISGDIIDMGRRYAITSPDSTADFLLPVRMDKEIGGLSLKGYTPRELIRLMTPGGINYVHGGISLQEMMVPVVIYKHMRSGSKGYTESINPGLALVSDYRKIANLIFSMEFLQEKPIGEKVQPCTYQVYFIDEEGKQISDTQSIVADRNESSALERTFRVKFNLKPSMYTRGKPYKLVISNDIDVPLEIEFQIDISLANDFGFDIFMGGYQ